jgi:murein DD-endopeptidase MepM/ murein hydrolase activator NlpD
MSIFRLDSQLSRNGFTFLVLMLGLTLGAACGNHVDGGGTSGEGTQGANLAGVASINFDAGALPDMTHVAIEQRTDSRLFALFDDRASIFRPVRKSSYYVRITTEKVRPTGPASVVLKVPPDFAVRPGDEVVIFARIFDANELETIEDFEPLDGAYDASAAKVTATIPPFAFTSGRSAEGTVEAILLLAARRPASGFGGQIGVEQQALGNVCISQQHQCPVACMHTPLRRTLRVTSPEDDPARAFHPGTDFRAEAGVIDAVAVGEGTVIESRWSPDPQTGMGETILLAVPDVGYVRYMHLQRGSRTIPDCCAADAQNPGGEQINFCNDPALPVCNATVTTGQVLGETGATGAAAGPHLHFEVLPFYALHRIDTAPCIMPPDYRGTITSRFHQASVGGEETMSSQADVTFEWSQAELKYKATGTVSFSLTVAEADCTASLSVPRHLIDERESDSLLLGGMMNELMTANYFLGKPPPPLNYVGGGESNIPAQVLTVTCPGRSSRLPFPRCLWWPTTLVSPSAPFYARPNPYAPGAPYEDLVETNVPNLPPPLTSYTSSWNLSARAPP